MAKFCKTTTTTKATPRKSIFEPPAETETVTENVVIEGSEKYVSEMASRFLGGDTNVFVALDWGSSPDAKIVLGEN